MLPRLLACLPRLALVALAAAVLALAWSTHTPWTLRLRPLEPGLVFGGAALGLALLARTARGARLVDAALAVTFLVAPALHLAREAAFDAARARVLSAPSAQVARLGAHVVVGYERLDRLEPLVARGAVAGVFVTQRNVRGRRFAEVAGELASLRASAPEGTHLLVAADQEGGLVSRLSPLLTRLPPLSSLLASGAVDAETVRAYARIHGRELARLGVDVNFGPVVDLHLHDGLGLLDAHTQLEDRAIAADPEAVAEVAAIYADELAAHGVSATLKHFPGLGRVRADTHLFDATLDAPTTLLAATDWRPYRALAGRRDVLVMVGHVHVPDVDPEHLSTFSPALLRGVLRRELGFAGPIVTDDLAMKPTYEAPGGIGESGVRALQAGADLLLVAYDPDQYYPLMAALLDADDEGRLDARDLDASAARIARRTGDARDPSAPELHLAGPAR